MEVLNRITRQCVVFSVAVFAPVSTIQKETVIRFMEPISIVVQLYAITVHFTKLYFELLQFYLFNALLTERQVYFLCLFNARQKYALRSGSPVIYMYTIYSRNKNQSDIL